jgi:hypothetical protein
VDRGSRIPNHRTGRLAWSASHAKTPAYSSPVAATIGGVRQIVAAAGDRVFAVAPADGRVLWSIAGLGPDKELANPPLVLPGDRVLYSSWDESVMYLAAGRGADGRRTLALAEVARLQRSRGLPGRVPVRVHGTAVAVPLIPNPASRHPGFRIGDSRFRMKDSGSGMKG